MTCRADLPEAQGPASLGRELFQRRGLRAPSLPRQLEREALSRPVAASGNRRGRLSAGSAGARTAREDGAVRRRSGRRTWRRRGGGSSSGPSPTPVPSPGSPLDPLVTRSLPHFRCGAVTPVPQGRRGRPRRGAWPHGCRTGMSSRSSPAWRAAQGPGPGRRSRFSLRSWLVSPHPTPPDEREGDVPTCTRWGWRFREEQGFPQPCGRRGARIPVRDWPWGSSGAPSPAPGHPLVGGPGDGWVGAWMAGWVHRGRVNGRMWGGRRWGRPVGG